MTWFTPTDRSIDQDKCRIRIVYLVLSFLSLAPLYWVADCIKKELFVKRCCLHRIEFNRRLVYITSLEILFLVAKVVFVCFSAPPQYWHKCFAHQMCVLDLNEGHLMIFVKVFFVCFSAYPQYWYKCFAHQVSICPILGKYYDASYCVLLNWIYKFSSDPMKNETFSCSSVNTYFQSICVLYQVRSFCDTLAQLQAREGTQGRRQATCNSASWSPPLVPGHKKVRF